MYFNPVLFRLDRYMYALPSFDMFPPVIILFRSEHAPALSQVNGTGEVENPPLSTVQSVASGHDGVVESRWVTDISEKESMRVGTIESLAVLIAIMPCAKEVPELVDKGLQGHVHNH